MKILLIGAVDFSESVLKKLISNNKGKIELNNLLLIQIIVTYQICVNKKK